jgi:hypothetical protein
VFFSSKCSLFHNSNVFGSCIIHILYIYSANIGTEYFKHGIYSPCFSLQNAVCFIIPTYLVLVLFTFYIQDVLKLKKNNSGAKILRVKVPYLDFKPSVTAWLSYHSPQRVTTLRPWATSGDITVTRNGTAAYSKDTASQQALLPQRSFL